MKTKLLLTLTTLLALAAVAYAQNTAFTCQGRFNTNAPLYPMRFYRAVTP